MLKEALPRELPTGFLVLKQMRNSQNWCDEKLFISLGLLVMYATSCSVTLILWIANFVLAYTDIVQSMSSKLAVSFSPVQLYTTATHLSVTHNMHLSVTHNHTGGSGNN